MVKKKLILAGIGICMLLCIGCGKERYKKYQPPATEEAENAQQAKQEETEIPADSKTSETMETEVAADVKQAGQSENQKGTGTEEQTETNADSETADGIKKEADTKTTDRLQEEADLKTTEESEQEADAKKTDNKQQQEGTEEADKKQRQAGAEEADKKQQTSQSQTGTIVIDAGHQSKGNNELEPIGPGASEKKAKVASGTQGVSTGIPEYKVTLQIAKKLRDTLEARGYNVIMVRESNDVNISNAERAEVANKNNADAFLRLHCNGVESSSATGALALCQTKNNPYCGEYYSKSRNLSECVLNGLCDASGAKNTGVREVDNMSGINWCKVPVTIIEMGYMTNPQEDRNLCDDSYQQKLADGIADGVDRYMEK